MIKSNLVKRLHDGDVTKIKLIGDSITFGVGADNSGDGTNPNGAIIFVDSDGKGYREAGYDIPSWANMFREYIGVEFPSVEFFNAGIGGRSSKWGNARKHLWVDDSEDVVFVMLGTNDRWDCANPEEFETNLSEFLAYVNDRSKTMVVMTATPTTTDDEPDKNFGMEEVDRVITKVCLDNGYEHISQYRLALDYFRLKKNSALDYIQSDGSHPVNAGYKMMWQTMQQQLGFIDNQEQWFDFTEPLQSIKVLSNWQDVTPETPINATNQDGSDLFNQRAITAVAIPNGHGSSVGFPENTGGMLVTYRFSLANDYYVWQEFNVYISNSRYRRRWNGSSWQPWVKEITGTNIETPPVIEGFHLPAGERTRKVLSLTQTLSATNMVTVSPITFIPDGIIWSWTKASNNLIYINFYNAKSTGIDVPNLTFKVMQMQ